MCVVSAVLDHHTRTWPEQFANAWPPINDPVNLPFKFTDESPTTREQLDTLRKEVVELSAQVEYLLELIPTLRKYDEDNNEPDCEMEDKIKLIRKICDALGIDHDVL